MNTTISYTPSIGGIDGGNNFITVDADTFLQLLEDKKPAYELTDATNDTLIKPYFDIDWKIHDGETYTNEGAEYLTELGKQYLEEYLGAFEINPKIAVATSHSNGFTLKDKNSKPMGKYSCRYFITNMLMTKQHMIILVGDINFVLNQDPWRLEAPNYTDYADEGLGNKQTNLFDNQVYSRNRKMRTVGTSKSGENRPLILYSGELQDTIITAFADPTSKVFEYPKSMKGVEPKSKYSSYGVVHPDEIKTIGELGKNKDEIEYYCNQGGFINDVSSHLGWITLGGTFMSILLPDDAFEMWQLATNNGGSFNKQLEVFDHFRHLKVLFEDPIIAINSIRKKIKKQTPSIFENWKKLQRQQQKDAEQKLKDEIKATKEAEKQLKDSLRQEREQEKEQKQLKKQEKENKKVIEKAEIETRRSENTFVSSDNDAIDVIINELGDKFVFSNGKMFYKDGFKWTHDDDKIDNILMKYILESKLYRTNDKAELIPYCQNVKTSKNVREGMLAKLSILKYDKYLYDKFHSSTKNKLCFIDGVLDLQKNSFTLWENIPENTIYTTVIIERCFATYFENPNKKFIDIIKKDIMDNLFGNRCDIALKFFSRAIGGNIEDKNFMSYSGNRNCGKGILFSLFSYAFGEYISPFNLENMMCRRESNKSSDLAKENAWLLPLEFARLAIAQETDENENGNISQKLKLSNKMIKSVVGGGDILTARPLYKDPVNFTIDATLAFFGNNELAINGDDSSQHHLKLNGVKQFITQEMYDEYKKLGEDYITAFAVRDETLKEKVKTDDYSNAMVYLLLNNFVNKSITIKNDCDEEEEENSVRKLIFMKFDITKDDDDRISKDILFATIKGDKKKILAELKQIGCVGDNNCKTTVKFIDEKGEEKSKRVHAFKRLKLKPVEFQEN
jgi:hypothetical protein